MSNEGTRALIDIDDYKIKVGELQQQLAEAVAREERTAYRLKRHEVALWRYVDRCFKYHMPPEGMTPTDAVCDAVEDAERELKGAK